MLNEFLKVAYAKSVKQQEQEELVALMKQLPAEELHKIAASGEIKLAFGGMCGDGGQSWVEQFKGTPFMEQAIGLEQELLQAEMANQQRNQVEGQRAQQSYAQTDQIRMKKRLLELQKVKGEMGTLQQAGIPVSGALPGEQGPDQGEGAPAGTDMAGMPAKQASVFLTEDVGRLMAQRDMAKIAHQRELLEVGDRAGRLMAKSAGLGGALIRVAQNNPGMVVGGALGAAHGLMKEDGGVGSAIGEGLLGGAAGHAVQGVGGRLARQKGGLDVGNALSGYGNQVRQEGRILSKGYNGEPLASDAAEKRLGRIHAMQAARHPAPTAPSAPTS